MQLQEKFFKLRENCHFINRMSPGFKLARKWLKR